MIGAQIATGQWRGQVGLSLTLAFVLMTAACGDGEPGDVPGTTTTEDAGNVPGNCHPVQLQPDGGCCAPGTFLDPGTASCMPFGPPECAAVLPDKPTACVPRW